MIDLDALRAADRRELGRAITLLESTRSDHRREAEELLVRVMPDTGRSIRIGITGVPGVGKSTFIEAFGNRAIETGRRVAVLTVDPTSSLSGGSILGDKTRMPTLSTHPAAFIRPSPAGRTLGGVARRTMESILLCEAAGFDTVIVETVGVGQSETLVAGMTDVFVLMLLPAGGDELQGIKRGVMELADIAVVNKSDGDLARQASVAAADVHNAMGLIRRRTPGWEVPVLETSAIGGKGIEAVLEKVREFYDLLASDGTLTERRQSQARDWLWQETREQLLGALTRDRLMEETLDGLMEQVSAGQLPASVAARELVDTFLESKK